MVNLDPYYAPTYSKPARSQKQVAGEVAVAPGTEPTLSNDLTALEATLDGPANKRSLTPLGWIVVIVVGVIVYRKFVKKA